MRKTVVLNVVGLTADLIRRAAPRLAAWAQSGTLATIDSAFPAVTCSAQSDYLTGHRADRHGVVANGWYERAECEIRFWRQSNKLVQAPKIWDLARAEDPSFTCANMFWWFNMYSSVDVSVTPRPMYPADGRKLPDVYSAPAALRDRLQQQLGTFPLFDFWGPRASIASTRWIADASKIVETEHGPTLTLVYLPHLDYTLQRIGPGSPAALEDVRQIDTICGELIEFYETRGADVIVLSEYGIRDVSRPVHINRALRSHGHLAVRTELGHELLDPGASPAFAVADHQVAHVYVNDPARIDAIRSLIESIPGVERVLDTRGRGEYGRIRHRPLPRSGDLVAIAEPDAWFTYYYWQDDERAPDFARTVEIHRKPGYDPVELFLDPRIRIPALTVGWKLARKGSHGRRVAATAIDAPVFISRQKDLLPSTRLASTDIHGVILEHLRRS